MSPSYTSITRTSSNREESKQRDQATLGARDEVFTYKVTTQVPQDVTGFAVYDTIEKVLEFAGENAEAVATLDGQALDASHISFKGQRSQ